MIWSVGRGRGVGLYPPGAWFRWLSGSAVRGLLAALGRSVVVFFPVACGGCLRRGAV